jgi:HK97 gp10 family phage protein
MSVIGADRHARRLRGIRQNADRIGQAVFVAADAIKTEARLSITRGSTSGKGHVASAPGQPPNRDTGHLDSNIESYRTGTFTAEVRSQAGYSAALEFGTKNMAERPFMRPAAKRQAPEMMQNIVVEVRRAARSG